MNILCIDIGTTSMRGILYNELGSIKGAKSILTPLIFDHDHIEQKPETYISGLLDICDFIQRYGEVDAISVTCMRSVVTLVDRRGEPLMNFIMWQDTRNKDVCERLKEYDDIVYQHTGAAVNAVFTGSKLAWCKENLPDLWKQAYKAVIVPDHLIHFMTGELSMDRTYGSRTNLMNINTGEWDEEMLGIFGIEKEILPDLCDIGIAGYTNRQFQQLTGIREGVPVISAGGDQQNSAIGLGELDASSLVINCGTGSFILSLSDAPYLENSSMICNAAAIKGKYILESNILSSAAALNWLIREVFPDEWHRGNPDFEIFNSIAASSPIGANGVFCVPLFQGCGTRSWNQNARAVFSNLSLGNTRADLARAMYEGIAAEITKSVWAMPDQCQNADKIYIGGGMTKSDFFDQILADMLGRSLYRYSDTQATAVGAFMNAALALQIYPGYEEAFAAVRRESVPYVFSPIRDHHDFYKEYLDETERVHQLLNCM